MRLFIYLFVILIVLTGCSIRTASRSEVEKMLKVQEAEAQKPDDIRMRSER